MCIWVMFHVSHLYSRVHDARCLSMARALSHCNLLVQVNLCEYKPYGCKQTEHFLDYSHKVYWLTSGQANVNCPGSRCKPKLVSQGPLTKPLYKKYKFLVHFFLINNAISRLVLSNIHPIGSWQLPAIHV